MEDKVLELFEAAQKYINAQKEAENKGEHEFICPICGSKAKWERAKINNHLHTGCSGCGLEIHE